jgi:hypothetical protein
MLIGSTWKARALNREQTNRMMAVWGKIEVDMAANPAVERLCWFIAADASAGVTVVRAVDTDAAAAYNLEIAVALSEFIEIDSRPVLDLESAMPAILAGIERTAT